MLEMTRTTSATAPSSNRPSKNRIGSGPGETARTIATLLNWMQEQQDVFVIATANDVRQLAPEQLRQGRFSQVVFVDLPSPEDRAEIFSIHLAKRGRDAGQFDVAALAACAENFSGAEIEQAVISALYDAFCAETDLRTEHILEALRQTVPLARTMDEQISRLRSWAEGRARNASIARALGNGEASR